MAPRPLVDLSAVDLETVAFDGDALDAYLPQKFAMRQLHGVFAIDPEVIPPSWAAFTDYVFAYADSSTTLYFRVDEEARSIIVRERGSVGSPEVFSGRFERDGTRMTLIGAFPPDSSEVRVYLRRIRPRPEADPVE